MKKIFLSVILLFSYSVIQSQESFRFTLEECLQYAFENSYQRQSNQLTEDARMAAYDQSKMERLPSLSASLGESFSHSKKNVSTFVNNNGEIIENSTGGSSWGGNAGLSASMPLYTGGSISSSIETARLQSRLAQSQNAQYDNNITIQILQAFLNVLGNEEMLATRQELFAATEEQLRQGEAMFRAGSIIESDLLLLKAQYASDYSTIVNTRVARNNSLLSLKNLLSMPPQTTLEIVYSNDLDRITDFIPLPEDEVVGAAMQYLPEMHINELNELIAQESIRQAKSKFLPSLNLSASARTAHSEFDDFGTQLNDRFNQSAGLSLSIPIFSNGRNRLALTQSKISAEKAKLDALQSELDIRQMVVVQYQNVISLYEQYKAGDINRNASLQSYEAYRAKFEQGSITAVELLRQQNNYISALNSYVQYKYGFMLNQKVLDVYMGKN